MAARKYESSHLIDGPMGHGWTASLAARLYYTTYLFAAPSTYHKEADITMPTGDRYRFVDNDNGTFTPPPGRHDTLVRNGDGTFDLTIQRTRLVYHFDSVGALQLMTDDYGNQLLYSYGGDGRLDRVQDIAGSGRFIDVYWGADGRISNLVDSTGRQVGYQYDNRGVLTSVTDPLGRATLYTYNSGKYGPLLAAVRDHWNRVVSEITYDPQDRVTSYSENGETYTYTFNYGGNPAKTAKRDSAGNEWVFTYGAGGLVTSGVAPAGSGTQTTAYYSDGSIQQATDETGIRTNFTYDGAGRLTSETLDYQGPTAVKVVFTYDSTFVNNVTSVTTVNPVTNVPDPNWQTRVFEYCPVGSPAPGALCRAARMRADGKTLDSVMTYAYDSHGRPVSKTDATGAVTHYAYDAAGDLVSIASPLNSHLESLPSVRISYDAAGRVTAMTDVAGGETLYTYDALGRTTSVTSPSPSPGLPAGTFQLSYTYDEFDPPTGLLFMTAVDYNGRSTRRGYDQYGRMIQVVEPDGGITSYQYARGRVASVRDANGNVTTYTRDAAGRIVVVTHPDGSAESFAYYSDGRLRSKTDRKGQTFTYTYDRLKRLSAIKYPNLSQLSFTYLGEKLVQVVDNTTTPPETHTFAYDDLFRLSAETQGTRGTVNYTYTPRDQVASYAVTGGASAAYTYFPGGRVRTIDWSPAGGLFEFSYTLRGQVEAITMPNGQRQEFLYDDLARLTRVANLDPAAGNLATFSYGYDDPENGAAAMLGQRTSVTADVPSLGLAGATTRYSYDNNYQLTGVAYPAGSLFAGEVDSWTYDGIGNRLTSTVNGVVSPLVYQKVGGNPNNWHRLLADGSSSYSYDSNGNTLAITGGSEPLSLAWNADNRLVGIFGALSVSYAYDYQGRRTRVSGDNGSREYVYSSGNAVLENESGAEYVFGEGFDQPLAMIRDGQIYYFAVDGMGSVTLVTESDGNVASSYVYDVWGRTRSQSVTVASPFGFLGHETDNGGLIYSRFRDLVPATGRFLSEDPLGLRPDMNLYRYVRNSPASFLDPLGLECTYDTVWGGWHFVETLSIGEYWKLMERDDEHGDDRGVPPPLPLPNFARSPRGGGHQPFFGLPWVVVDCIWEHWHEETVRYCKRGNLLVACTCPNSWHSYPLRECKDIRDRKLLGRINNGRISAFGYIECPHPEGDE